MRDPIAKKDGAVDGGRTALTDELDARLAAADARLLRRYPGDRGGANPSTPFMFPPS